MFRCVVKRFFFICFLLCSSFCFFDVIISSYQTGGRKKNRSVYKNEEYMNPPTSVFSEPYLDLVLILSFAKTSSNKMDVTLLTVLKV